MKRLALLWVMAYSLWGGVATAQEFDYRDFARLPVLHEGRIKPLDTLARVHLRRFYGQEALPDRPAAVWLAEALLAPERAAERAVFRIGSPHVVAMLGLPHRQSPLYSYSELAAPMDRKKEVIRALETGDAGRFTAQERALWALYENISDFAQLSRAFSLLVPLEIGVSETLRESLELQTATPPTYLDLRGHIPQLNERLKQIVKQKGDAIAAYTPSEQEIALLSFALTALELTGRRNHLLRVIPSPWSRNGEWYSLWQLIEQGQGAPQTAELLRQWQALAQAYRQGDAEGWQRLVPEIGAATAQLSGANGQLLALEAFYNQAAPLALAAALYGIVALLALAGLRWDAPRLAMLTRTVLAAAVTIHAAAIVLRVLLLQRPPVGTLYESVLFVALIAAAYGLWLGARRAPREGPLIGGLLGGGLLAVSDTYAGQGDSIGMLVAVLNTNFWLATHVLCITVGYGCALIAGTLGHLALLPATAAKTTRLLPFAAVLALLFTAIGTILGGIWADQSWGRFWGWDPKENGALLIVLWLIWLLHGRVTGMTGERGFAALLALTNIIVALSWFGVNLLNTGLHSYGFTDSAAYGLAIFCAAEAVIVAGLYGRGRPVKSR